jgi:hypothetical protein
MQEAPEECSKVLKQVVGGLKISHVTPVDERQMRSRREREMEREAVRFGRNMT